MRNLNKILIVITSIFIFFLTSCTTFESTCNVKLIYANKEEVIIINEGEKLKAPLDDYLFGYEFIGWYLDDELYDFNNKITSNITLVAKHIKKDYVPKWELNESGFNGNEMDVVIFYGAIINRSGKRIYDPYDENYAYLDKEDRIKHLEEVEKAYNINIKYESIDKLINKEINPDTPYIYMLPTDELFVSKYWYSFYSLDERFINQNDILNNTCENVVYNTNQNDEVLMIYYNSTILEELNLDDPQKLWQEGKWTINSFEEYLANLSLVNNEYNILSNNYLSWVQGLASSMGVQLANNIDSINYLDQNVNLAISKVKKWRDLNYIGGDYIFGAFFQNDINLKDYLSNNTDSKIKAVPFPIMDEEAHYILENNLNQASYSICTNAPDEFYAISNTADTKSLTKKDLENILHDLVNAYNGKAKIYSHESFDSASYESLLDQIKDNKKYDYVNVLNTLFDLGTDSNIYKINYAIWEYCTGKVVSLDMNFYKYILEEKINKEIKKQ